MAQLTKKITDLTAIEGINGEDLLIIDDGSETCKITANELAEYINGKSSAQPNVQSDWNETDAESDAYIKNKPSALAASDVYEWAKAQTKPAYTAAEVGADQSGSAAIALASSKKYTDDRITQLIGTSPENLDTIEELGAAISQNQSAIDAIENAITNKADSDHDHDELYAAKSSEHTHENKEVLDAITAVPVVPSCISQLDNDTGYITSDDMLNSDTANNTVTYASADSASPSAWTNVALLSSNEKHSSIFNKISAMFKNIRYLYKMLGTTDISTLGNGTVTGIINELSTGLNATNSNLESEIVKTGQIEYIYLDQTLGATSNSAPWLELKAQYNSFVNHKLYIGRINAGAQCVFIGMRTSDAYGTFLVQMYKFLYHIYIHGGQWYYETLTNDWIPF